MLPSLKSVFPTRIRPQRRRSTATVFVSASLSLSPWIWEIQMCAKRPRGISAASRGVARRRPPPPAPQLSASPPGGPWGLRLDQADPGRPGEAPARSRACRARPAPPGAAVSREGGGQLSAPARAVPGRRSDPLQGESRPGGRHPPPRLPSNQPPGCLRSCLLKFNLSLKHSIKNGLLVS